VIGRHCPDGGSGEALSDRGCQAQANEQRVRTLPDPSYFFDVGVDPSKRRCRDRRGSGRSAGTAKGSAPRTLQAGWRSITLGFRPKLPGMEAATPVIRSQVHASRGAATATEPIECERMEKKMRKGTAEGGA
jgi:hypothetical protein